LQSLLENALERFILSRGLAGDGDCELNMAMLRRVNHRLPSILGALSIIDDDKAVAQWPKVPLGQFVWQAVQNQGIANLVRAWVTGASIQAMRTNPDVIVACPDHPDLFLPAQTGVKCQARGCGKYLCPKCLEWHGPMMCRQWEGKRCPACHAPTIKEQGCNHISCPCGTHWCFKCDVSPIFKKQSECYLHMQLMHGSFV
jgi:hypothetical protein